uniref:Pre-rRNA-processing protein TSR1 homolog n=1 Tax=Heterorhabditis bacteriophora TaxID=37862 RepID=A0A1I7XPC8_HETBA
MYLSVNNIEKRKVPKGTSSYQAAWILDDSEEESDNDSTDSDEDMLDSDVDNIENEEPIKEEESEEEEEMVIDDNATEASEMPEDIEINMDEVERYRRERENAQFPDEIDTPVDIPARIRFQKYRGLKSFRFNFPCFSFFCVFTKIKVFYFQMERFMPTKSACVASFYAPITFPPASVLVFRKDQKGRQELVASGSVLDINPDRIILKRIVLSGHPFKINKRSVVCRYMFFHRGEHRTPCFSISLILMLFFTEDIDWFKPVEVYTPSGRRGHIKEPLGTHGHMKCKFDQQLNAQDSVMMSLYKRVFPKWTYNPRVEKLAPSRTVAREIQNGEEMVE